MRREAAEITARKKSIAGILSNVAELGAARMEETIGKASLRDRSDRNRDRGGQDARVNGSGAKHTGEHSQLAAANTRGNGTAPSGR
jgi:hypothetical protein